MNTETETRQNSDQMTKKQDRLLVGGTSLETIAVIAAVTGIAISSFPLTSISIIPAILGGSMLKKLLSEKEKEKKTQRAESHPKPTQ